MITQKQSKIHKMAEEITLKIIHNQIKNKKNLHEEKKKLCKEYHLTTVPSNADILGYIPLEVIERYPVIKSILRKKPVRTISGVAVVAVMTSPQACPHGQCVICPGGPPFSPQSYTGQEPAALRAMRNMFDPFKQTQGRIKQLEAIGHPTDKIELIIMGGTFTARSSYYQAWFIQKCYEALNQVKQSSLQKAMDTNKLAKHRCIGLTIETRPDWLRLRHIDNILRFGATRVELGVQTTYDDVLLSSGRQHLVTDSVHATQMAKDAGLKICYHLMLGLPGSTREKDFESFKEIFDQEKFRPDMIKIYPTLVLKGTKLYSLLEKGEYTPLHLQETIRLIAKMKRIAPPWVRIQRIERDIPAHLIEAGIKKSNLRQLIKKEMNQHGWQCQCIRCREVGHRAYKDKIYPQKIEEARYDYMASKGKEIFISLEDKKNNLIIGYCRLRIPHLPHRPEITHDSAIIRELKIHGDVVEIGKKPKSEYQHRGWGEQLVRKAENISKEHGIKKLLVLSGIGVKNYYYRLGFIDDGLYVSKTL